MLNFGNKVENNGATPEGRLTANEFNQTVAQINQNTTDIHNLDEAAVKQLRLNGTTYQPDSNGMVEAVINVGTTMNVSRKKANIVAKLGSQILLEYSFMSVSSLGSTGDGEATYYMGNENTQPLATAQIAQSSAVDDFSVSFDVTNYISGVGQYTFIVVVYDSQNNRSSIQFTVEAIEFTVANLLNQGQTFALNSQIPYRYKINGSGSANKSVYFYLTRRATGDRVLAGTATVIGSDTANLGYTLTPSNIPITWAHGAYMLEVYATITDGIDTIYSNTIAIDLMIAEDGNTTPIISFLNDWEAGFNNTARVYETIITKVSAYLPENDSAVINLKVNGDTVSSINLENLEIYTWNYTIESEMASLILSAALGAVTLELPDIEVSGKLVDVEETEVGIALKLSSRGRSNDDANRDIWRSENTLYGNYQAVFNGFNWSSNGWLDAGGARALHVANGASVSIPFKMFGSDANTIVQTSGRTIEIEFIASNAIDYEDNNRIISCFANNIGFYITPRMVYFQNSAGSSSSLSTYFKEGERVRVGFVFQSIEEGAGMYLYLNGKQSGYYVYEQSHSFRQASPADLVINSTKCDVDIFRIMVYNSSLTKTQMVNNFITGKDDVSDMLTVFNRNNIFYNGALSPTLLQQQLPVMIMTANGLHDWMTQKNIDKKMKIIIDIQYIDLADPRKSFTATGVTLQFQGTSSMGYPVRNFKIKFKGSTITGDSTFVGNQKYKLRENSFAVKTFCLKADFAESSGSHNTGAARLINDVLTTAVSGSSHLYLTPPQAANQTGKDVRTTIDGFPMVLFSRESAMGEATFVGKYNFNNDKSTQEVFGFEGITGFNADLTNRTDILPEEDDYRTNIGDINSRSVINPCECWEFKSNDVDLCKFKFNSDSDLTHEALVTAFESRYPEEYAAPSETEDATLYEDTQWGHYELKKVLNWVHSTDTTKATGNSLPTSAFYNGVTYYNDTAEYRRAKFKAEVEEHFNLNNLLSYFLLTDLLGAVDQRAKNQMMASWGNEGAGDFKWYFIFYDNDTILGINNTGKIAHDYDLVSDTVGGYSGKDSVLWINLEYCFFPQLCECWDKLISASKGNVSILSYDNLIAEFNTRQSDMWAESVFNEDSNYKYVYQGGAENKDADYYTVLQGSRAEHRKYWIYNRLLWINGKYKSKNFLAEGTGWRCNKVNEVNGSESLKLTIVGSRKQYYGYIIGNTTNEVFLLDEGDSRFCEYNGGWDYTNLNLAGYEYMAEVGDISHMLPSDVKIASMTRLKKLILSSQTFQNTYLTNLSLTNKPFLEEVDISYASNLQSISDSSGCYRLKTFKAFHSGLTTTPFADGCDLEYAELPDTVTTVVLKNLKYLTFENLKMQGDDYSNITSLHIENCPGIAPLDFFELVHSNVGLDNVVMLNIDEELAGNSVIFEHLAALATSNVNSRITGTITTDNIPNIYLGILESAYPALTIVYDNVLPSTNIIISSATSGILMEGDTVQLSASLTGITTYQGVRWSVVGGQQYASVLQTGIVSATEQLQNNNYEQVVTIRATLQASEYVYKDFDITVKGIAATGGVINGDYWLSSQDGTVMPTINNNTLTLLPANCTKRAQNIVWSKDPTDPNYGYYDINASTGAVTFVDVKAVSGTPVLRRNEFTVRLMTTYRVFGQDLTTYKTVYVDYPKVGDLVYSNGAHSSTFYHAEVNAGTFSLVGACFYVNADGTDRRMVATRNACTSQYGGVTTCMWGVQGYDVPTLANKGGYYDSSGSLQWGTGWLSIYNGDPATQVGSANGAALGDMAGEQNTAYIIAQRVANGFSNLSSYSDVSNAQNQYPAASFCKVYGNDDWDVGKVGDWWLPSGGELALVYLNLKHGTTSNPNYVRLSNIGSTFFVMFSGGTHWSSSETNSNTAVTVNFDSGYLYNLNKSGSYSVRAVSAF